MKERILFTSESVSEGHPDKVCDQISDAILDECFKQDPNSRVACECFATTNLVVIGGEITTNAKVDYEAVARNVLKEIGYDDEAKGMDYKTCKVEVVMDSQSSDIALGTNEEVGGAGDQGIMFGYATKETEGYMPLAISIAHHLVRYASTLRHDGTFKWARPDMKAQVTIDLLLADDQQVGDALEFVFADLAADFLVAVVHLGPHVAAVEVLRDLQGVVVELLRNGEHHDLLGREPQRELAARMLQQYGHETLHRAERRAVNHDRAVQFVVRALVRQVEPLRQVVVHLNGSQLPLAADGVLDHEVELGTVERGFATSVKSKKNGAFHKAPFFSFQ